MKDEERLIRALNELADIARRKESEREKERELEKVRAERRIPTRCPSARSCLCRNYLEQSMY